MSAPPSHAAMSAAVEIAAPRADREQGLIDSDPRLIKIGISNAKEVRFSVDTAETIKQFQIEFTP
ncbi:MAG: hypothetical protein ABMB14_30340 [Myxococcota bacterium]